VNIPLFSLLDPIVKSDYAAPGRFQLDEIGRIRLAVPAKMADKPNAQDVSLWAIAGRMAG